MSSGSVRCFECGGYWTWDEAPRETWPSPYAHTWNDEHAARAYTRQHVCGSRYGSRYMKVEVSRDPE